MMQPPFYVASDAEEALTSADAVILLEELLEAQNQSFLFGLKLNLPFCEVKAIHSEYSDPRERLLHVISAFLRRDTPTWKSIVEPLRSPAINELSLAKKIKTAHVKGEDSAGI